MLASLLLLVTAPACTKPSQTFLSGENYRVSVECRAHRDGLHFSFIVSNLEEPGGAAIERLAVSFRGNLRRLSTPHGWTAKQRSAAEDVTKVSWQAKPKNGVAAHQELPGFAATVDGPNAALSCRWYEVSFGFFETPEGVGTGGGILGGCVP